MYNQQKNNVVYVAYDYIYIHVYFKRILDDTETVNIYNFFYFVLFCQQ